jgi:hypothetical protein
MQTEDWHPGTEYPQRVGRFDRWYEHLGLPFEDFWDGKFWRETRDHSLCADQGLKWREVR